MNVYVNVYMNVYMNCMGVHGVESILRVKHNVDNPLHATMSILEHVHHHTSYYTTPCIEYVHPHASPTPTQQGRTPQQGKYSQPGGPPPDARLVKYKGRYAEAESRYGPKPNVYEAVEAYVGLAGECGMSPTELAIRYDILVVGGGRTKLCFGCFFHLDGGCWGTTCVRCVDDCCGCCTLRIIAMMSIHCNECIHT